MIRSSLAPAVDRQAIMALNPVTGSHRVMAHILIVEDDPADVCTASAALAKVGLAEIDPVATVAEAHCYLDEVREKKRESPALILLDLSLGYESGFEILRRWRSDSIISAPPLLISPHLRQP